MDRYCCFVLQFNNFIAGSNSFLKFITVLGPQSNGSCKGIGDKNVHQHVIGSQMHCKDNCPEDFQGRFICISDAW